MTYVISVAVRRRRTKIVATWPSRQLAVVANGRRRGPDERRHGHRLDDSAAARVKTAVRSRS